MGYTAAGQPPKRDAMTGNAETMVIAMMVTITLMTIAALATFDDDDDDL